MQPSVRLKDDRRPVRRDGEAWVLAYEHLESRRDRNRESRHHRGCCRCATLPSCRCGRDEPHDKDPRGPGRPLRHGERSRARLGDRWCPGKLTCLDPFQFDSRLADVAQPTLRIFVEASSEQSSYRRWCTRGERLQVRLSLKDACEDVCHLFALERALRREHLVEHAAECPDVGPFVDHLAARLFRAHVGRSAENRPESRRRRTGDGRRHREARSRGFRLECLGQPEVEHFHRAVWTYLDIGGLEIAMNDALLVRGLERLGDLACDRQCLVQREAGGSGRTRPTLDLRWHTARWCCGGRCYDWIDSSGRRSVTRCGSLRTLSPRRSCWDR
jgi:hypothetical protein